MSQSTVQASTRAESPAANRRNGHEPEPNPFDTPAANAAQRARSATAAATADRLTRWKYHQFALDTLPRGQTWARDLHWRIGCRNAERDRRYPPVLRVTGAEVIKAGASDAQIEALRRLEPTEIGAIREREATEHEAERQRIREGARRINAARDCAVAPPAPVSLADLLGQPDDEQTYRIADLWPTAGRVLLAAPYKAGKSTLVGNVVRALVDGGQFLDRFNVTTVRKVALIDTELDTGMLRRWLRDQGIQNTGAVSVVPLRGALSTFDLTDPTTRSHWARQLAGADVVILDCLRPVLDSLGLSEDKDAGRLLVAFDALLAEIGATEGLVVTHMGHQNERARGDSRLLDWPDALWKIVRGDDADDGTRRSYFSALGRDVDVAEGLLDYDAATRRQTYSGGSRKDSTALAAMPELMDLVRREPGTLSKNAAVKRLMEGQRISQKAARATIDKAISDGAIIATPGPRNSLLLAPAPGDPFDLPGPPSRTDGVE